MRACAVSARHFLTVGFLLFAILIVILPASLAGAQSWYLEGMDLLSRNNSMVSDYAEARLSGDFLDVLMRIDAGALGRNTFTGALAPGAVGSPNGETNGLYAAYHVGGAEMDSLSTGYDADIKGGSVGYQRWLGDTLYALNLASTKAEGDFTAEGLDVGSEEHDFLSVGLHAMGIYHDNITWRGRIAGFKNEHEYGGTAGNSERAEYESTCINAGAMVGYLMRLGRQGCCFQKSVGSFFIPSGRVLPSRRHRMP
jgi:hypothetical protein